MKAAMNGDPNPSRPLIPKIRPEAVASVPLSTTSSNAARMICCSAKLNSPIPASNNAK